MHFTPQKHQELATAHLVENNEAALFAGMGLGKTAATLAAIVEKILAGDTKGVLIVSPLRVTNYTWPAEVAKWDQFKWLTVANLRTKEGLEMWDKGTANVYLINYEALHLEYQKKFPVERINGAYFTPEGKRVDPENVTIKTTDGKKEYSQKF